MCVQLATDTKAQGKLRTTKKTLQDQQKKNNSLYERCSHLSERVREKRAKCVKIGLSGRTAYDKYRIQPMYILSGHIQVQTKRKPKPKYSFQQIANTKKQTGTHSSCALRCLFFYFCFLTFNDQISLYYPIHLLLNELIFFTSIFIPHCECEFGFLFSTQHHLAPLTNN